MSIPSAISAPVPHNAYYGYSSHQTYQDDSSLYGTNAALMNGASRIAPYNNFASNTPVTITRTPTNLSSSRQPPATTMSSSQSDSVLQGAGKRDRRPDWHEFYKNGPPKEIIIIDDDSPPPPKRAENERINHTTRTLMKNDHVTHTNKKRKTAQAPAYEPVHYQHASYAKVRSDGETGSDTISTDRTMSLQTTAPTSLGSSLGSSGAYAEAAAVGQKRKRVTRQQTADEKKRREIEVVGDAYSSYVPPPKPPIKAKDVHVPPVREVRSPVRDRYRLLSVRSPCLGRSRSMTRTGITLWSPTPTWGRDVSPCILKQCPGSMLTGCRSSAAIARARYVWKGGGGLRSTITDTMCDQDHSVGAKVSGCLSD
jgi:dual-specificity kinase